MNFFKIISHRRSGTHFLWETLKSNFDLKKSPSPEGDMGGFKWHLLHKYTSENFVLNNTCVFLIRDPRDTLTSLWYYWKKGAESWFRMDEFLKGKSFSEYIRGPFENDMSKIEFAKTSPDFGHFLDPVQHWIDYTEWSNYVYTIRFEDLKHDPIKVLDKFSEKFKIKPIYSKYKLINNLVGHFPRKGVSGDWKNLFSKDDEEYIKEKVLNTMLKFNYI